MFGFLRDLGLEPVEWEQAVAATGRSTPTTKETIDAAFAVARTVVVLLTPDEEVRLHSDLAGGDGASVAMQPRPNVYIELGMAFALHPDRVVIVEIGGVRPASDLDGMNTIRLRGGAKELAALRSRLEIAGVQLSPSGSTDWLDGERFSRLEACSRVPVVDHRGELQNTRGGRSQPEAPGSADRAQVARVSAEVKYNGLENEIIFLITNHSDSAIYDVSWFHVTAENSWAASHQPFSLAPGESHTDTLPATVNRAIEAGRVAGFLLRDNAGVHWIKWGDAVVEQARNDLSQQISGRRNLGPQLLYDTARSERRDNDGRRDADDQHTTCSEERCGVSRLMALAEVGQLRSANLLTMVVGGISHPPIARTLARTR